MQGSTVATFTRHPGYRVDAQPGSDTLEVWIASNQTITNLRLPHCYVSDTTEFELDREQALSLARFIIEHLDDR